MKATFEDARDVMMNNLTGELHFGTIYITICTCVQAFQELMLKIKVINCQPSLRNI